MGKKWAKRRRFNGGRRCKNNLWRESPLATEMLLSASRSCGDAGRNWSSWWKERERESGLDFPATSAKCFRTSVPHFGAEASAGPPQEARPDTDLEVVKVLFGLPYREGLCDLVSLPYSRRANIGGRPLDNRRWRWEVRLVRISHVCGYRHACRRTFASHLPAPSRAPSASLQTASGRRSGAVAWLGSGLLAWKLLLLPNQMWAVQQH